MEKIVIKRMSENKYDDIMSVISKYDEDALDDLEWFYPRCAFVYEDEIEMQEFDPVDFIKYVSSAISKMDKSSKEYCNLNEFLKSQKYRLDPNCYQNYCNSLGFSSYKTLRKLYYKNQRTVLAY